VDYTKKNNLLWSHLKGKSYRTLSQEQNKSLGTIRNYLKKELSEIPENEFVTLKYCQRRKWGGVLLVDAKYVKVKGYKKKIAFIYGIDFLTHDIPVCLLGKSENYQICHDFFVMLKNSNYPLRGIVTDELESIFMACKHVWGDKILRQLCHTHFAEKIRRKLKVRTEKQYVEFMRELERIIFFKQSEKRFRKKKKIKKELHELALKCPGDMVKLDVLVDISDNFDDLTNYLKIGQCPKTNNLIESYNSQLEGRLKTIKGFESFKLAKQWLNAWILCRRNTKFFDCEGDFKCLNGKTSLEVTKKTGIIIPDFFPK